MNLIERMLLDHYEEFGLAAAGLDRRFATAVLTPRFATSRHVVALAFPAGAARPAVVVKVPRVPGDNVAVEREASVLRRLAELAGPRLPGIPAVLGTCERAGHLFLVESAVVGRELDPGCVARERNAALAAGTSFVEALPMVQARASGDDWYDALVGRPVDRLVRMVPDGPLAVLRDRTHAVLAPLRRAALPVVFEHGDLSHPNLFLLSDDSLGVIDWERAGEHGLPGRDLVFFLQYVGESVASAFTRPAQAAAFDDAFGAGGWARPLLGEHLARRNVSADLLPAIVVAGWARSAASLTDRLGSEGDDAAVAAAGVIAGDRDVLLWERAVEMAEAEG